MAAKQTRDELNKMLNEVIEMSKTLNIGSNMIESYAVSDGILLYRYCIGNNLMSFGTCEHDGQIVFFVEAGNRKLTRKEGLWKIVHQIISELIDDCNLLIGQLTQLNHNLWLKGGGK